MAKWFGKIGYSTTEEVEPGIYDSIIKELPYRGDIMSSRWKRQNSGEINDDINISNSISIIADPFANQNLGSMAYVECMGAKWKISDVEIQFPRLILTVGGLYNG